MDHSNSNREKILSAAANLFRTQGYHAVSLNQITKDSKTSRGSIYYYFPDGKEQLALEAIKTTGERRKKFIEHYFALEEDAALAIYNHIAAMGKERIESLNESAMSSAEISLVSMSSEVWSSNETLRQACEEVYTEWQQMYSDKLVQSGYDPETAQRLGVAIQAWIEGAYVLSVTKKNFSPMNIVGEQILNILKNN